ncbi:LytR family transcriptional regulator [Micromonospora terminaliae]|uniref:LytR family transcriptional regulator n=1 Tax=Micromonospora terminaliae TaxID=1914461 RepID=A0AAJ3DJM3_9ACTN|nr:LCP family protein [Micromonospora terminaliae]NES26045.1 LytR family transcriptional regulator [Micromonospora terminaliae]QGL50249.1 LytR family transcriptional regulator [Micromonospora terminaliae]
MIEDDLRAAFARREELTPAVGPVRAAIDRAVVRRRRRRLRLRLAGTALAVVAAALAGFTAVAPRQPDTADLIAAPATPPPSGALNVLLLGSDAAGPDGSRRADSILLVHLPADRSRLYLVSLPRDLVVPTPGRGTAKLNLSLAAGKDLAAGYQETRQVVAQLTGVRIDAGAVLTYRATRELTDAVGGVPVCLPTAIRSYHTRRTYPAGCQRLDGAAAVDLLRQRYNMPEGAVDRDRNAARYAAGLLQRVQEQEVLTNPLLLSRLITKVGPDLVTDTGESSLPALVSAAGAAANAEPVAVGLPVRHGTTKELPYGFRLDPTLAPGFLDALRTDRLGEWTAAHPKQVTTLR